MTTEHNWEDDVHDVKPNQWGEWTGGVGDENRFDLEGSDDSAWAQGGEYTEVGGEMPPMPRDPNAEEERRKLRNMATGGIDVGHAPGQPGEPDIEDEVDLRAGPYGIDAPHDPEHPGDAAYPGEKHLPGMRVPPHSGRGENASGDAVGEA